MRMRLTDSPPRTASAARVAFLHESRDPVAGMPRTVSAGIKAAVKAAGFQGKEKEVASPVRAPGPGPCTASGRHRRRPAGGGRWFARPSGRRALDLADSSCWRLAPGCPRPTSGPSFRRSLSRTMPSTGTRPLARGAAPSGQAIVVPPPGVSARSLSGSAREAEAVAQAVAWARDVGNTPGNDLGPAELAAEAKALCARHRVACRVLGRKEIEKERMGGLLGVNAGSARPPVFLVGEHAPARSRGTVVLVGKGITFDSGGISLKPPPSMGEMKYDMMGAATVFACLAAASALRLPVRIVALAPVTENMPGGTALRPGDILRMRNGQTVEVDNTDAEGRLVLADALSYAEKFSPDVHPRLRDA